METFPLSPKKKRSFACMKNIFLIIFWVAELAKCFFCSAWCRLEIRMRLAAIAEFLASPTTVCVLFLTFSNVLSSSYMLRRWEEEEYLKTRRINYPPILWLCCSRSTVLWWVSTLLMTRFVAIHIRKFVRRSALPRMWSFSFFFGGFLCAVLASEFSTFSLSSTHTPKKSS